MRAQELGLPPQHVIALPLRFSAIEHMYYNAQQQRCIELLERYETEREGSLRRTAMLTEMVHEVYMLRQLCCHPQIGQGNREGKGGTLFGLLACCVNMRASECEAEGRA